MTHEITSHLSEVQKACCKRIPRQKMKVLEILNKKTLFGEKMKSLRRSSWVGQLTDWKWTAWSSTQSIAWLIFLLLWSKSVKFDSHSYYKTYDFNVYKQTTCLASVTEWTHIPLFPFRVCRNYTTIACTISIDIIFFI